MYRPFFHRRSGIDKGIFNARITQTIQERHSQERFSVDVWAGIVGNDLVGLYILPPRLTAVACLQFLNEHLPNLLSDTLVATRRDRWYLQNGAPAYSGREVRRRFDQHFPKQ